MGICVILWVGSQHSCRVVQNIHNASLICRWGDLDIKYSEYMDEIFSHKIFFCKICKLVDLFLISHYDNSQIFSISNSVSISHGMSWLTHGISCDCFDCEPHHGSGQHIRVLWPHTSVFHLMIVSWRECLTVWGLLIKFPQVCHHHWSGLCQHFKCAPHFCLQVVV